MQLTHCDCVILATCFRKISDFKFQWYTLEFKPAANPLSGAEFGHFSCVVCLSSLVRMRMHTLQWILYGLLESFTSVFTVIAGHGAEFTFNRYDIDNFLQ